MKRLKDILDSYTDKEILDRLFKIYPDQEGNKDGYEKVLVTLRELKPVWSDYILYASKTDITGKAPNDDTRHAMEFTDWAEWLTMKVRTTYSYLDALCFCLWEMTFIGYTQKSIKGRLGVLNKRVKEISQTKGGKE